MTIVLNLGIKREVERVLQIVDKAFFGSILYFQRWVNIRPKTILLLRQDAIGDYVLFRNFISVLKASERFKDHKITLCGNSRWRELSETCDSDSVSNFIWLDKTRFQLSRPYKYFCLLTLCAKGYSILIHPTFSRDVYADSLVRFIKAEQKIGSQGDPTNKEKSRRATFDKFYDLLLDAAQEPMFEFLRNKEFFENLIGAPITLEDPRIDVTKLHRRQSLRSPYAVIAPGAREASRRWPTERFGALARHLQSHYDLDIVITGSKEERKLADEVLSFVEKKRGMNIAGEVSLSDLVKIISESLLLVSNDTGTIHLSAAVDANAVCISNGNHFGRFVPYPAEIAKKLFCVYPEEMSYRAEDFDILVEKFKYASKLDIGGVSFDVVKETVDGILDARRKTTGK